MKKIHQILLYFLISNTIGMSLYLLDILGKEIHIVLEITMLIDGLFLGLLLGYGLWVMPDKHELQNNKGVSK